MLAYLVPGLLAGLVAIAVTVAIERWGGRVGGLLGTLPTTIVPASLGIAGQTDEAGLAAAMHAVPAGMLLNAGFLWLWRAVPSRLPPGPLPRRLAMMTALSLCAWFVGATALTLGLGALGDAPGRTAAVGVLAMAAILVVGVLACLGERPAPRGRAPVSAAALVSRGVLAGVAIATAVWVTQVGGPLAAGVASVFPAIFVTAMVSLWLAQGEAVPAGAVGPMMLGSAAVGGYALLAAPLLPLLGPALGSVAAWVGAVLTTTVPAWWWLGRRARAAAA